MPTHSQPHFNLFVLGGKKQEGRGEREGGERGGILWTNKQHFATTDHQTLTLLRGYKSYAARHQNISRGCSDVGHRFMHIICTTNSIDVHMPAYSNKISCVAERM